MALIRIDQRSLPRANHPVWVICPVRNEMAILPDFMRHYRSIGIDTFCFIDNGSIDGTREYLLAQDDCIVLYTDESYFDSHFAVDWLNRAIAEFQISGWLILVDADEHICYSHMERRDIGALLAGCDLNEADALYGIMVDMYPAGNFMDMRVRPGDKLNQIMPYFDENYIFRKWPRRSGKEKSLQILGGPRCRLLSALDVEARRGWIFSTATNQVDRFVEYVPQKAMPWLARIWPREVPAQIKTPINFVRPGFRFNNSHASTNQRFSSELVSLLHFKFCTELQARFVMAANEGNHYRRGLSYLQLQQALQKLQNCNLMHSGSRRFSSSGDLHDVGLVGTRAAIVWESGFTKEFRSGLYRPRKTSASLHTPSTTILSGTTESSSADVPSVRA
jgi:hypothetical protein